MVNSIRRGGSGADPQGDSLRPRRRSPLGSRKAEALSIPGGGIGSRGESFGPGRGRNHGRLEADSLLRDRSGADPQGDSPRPRGCPPHGTRMDEVPSVWRIGSGSRGDSFGPNRGTIHGRLVADSLRSGRLGADAKVIRSEHAGARQTARARTKPLRFGGSEAVRGVIRLGQIGGRFTDGSLPIPFGAAGWERMPR